MREKGITLLELLITMAVLAIVLAMGSPVLESSVRRAAIDSQVNQLQTTVNFARARAVARNGNVSICRSSDGAVCATTGSSGDWTIGWIVFTDAGTAGVVDGSDSVLRVQNQVAKRTSILFQDVGAVITARNFIQFDRLGAPADVSGGAQQSVFSVCDDSANAFQAKGVFINALGRPARTRDLDGNGIEEWQLGSDISC